MQNRFKEVTIVGLGYIGLPTAALIARRNIKVNGVDVQSKVVDIINQGQIHIVEPDLAGLVKIVVANKMLKASTKVKSADAFIIAVPTPFKENHIPDISYVENATNSIIPKLKKGDLFIIESTSPVGTTEKMAELIYSKRPELKNKIFIAYCPERVLPGNVLYELIHNDRVIGGIDEASTQEAIQFYRSFVKADLHPTNARTAELVKLTENSSRDVQIAFANELSMICDKADIDVWELIYLANKHPRVNILQPGAGVGGHCIAVDPWFIVADFEEEAKIIRTAREINNYKTEWVIQRIVHAAEDFEDLNARKPKIALMGLAFKPDIDDLRESPALYIAIRVKKILKDILVSEPNIKTHDEFIIEDSVAVINKADIIVFLVAHREYKTIKIPKKKIVLDFCGVKKKKLSFKPIND